MYRNSTALLAVLVLLSSTSQAETPDDFAHTIAPILRKHCVECHGGREAKGGFSINTRKSFLDEDYAIPKDAEASYFLDLILSDDPEAQMPPPDKPRLTEEEVQKLTSWVEAGMTWDSEFTFAEQLYEPPLKPFAVTLPPVVDGRQHPIDRLIDNYFDDNDVKRPQSINDATFYRRVSMDLVGLLPEAESLDSFIKNTAPDKREQLVEELLSDQIDYADHWLSFWNDLLRNDYTGTGFITGGRKQVSKWLYESLLVNMPYDQFARELIAPPSNESRGFIDGIKWRGEVSAGQTLEIQFSQSISQAFLGLNMKCASCHDSFVDRWTLKEAYGLAAIYSQRELKIHRCDKPTGEVAKAAWLFPQLGDIDSAASQPERLQQLARLMTHQDNGRFTRTIVNRLWATMMGRGLVHPLDAMQSEPWNAELLELLSNHLRENNYDLKTVLKFIAASEAYQSQTVVGSQSEPDGGYVFRGPISKRMTAEQFLDGVWQITQAGPIQYDAPFLRLPTEPTVNEEFELLAKRIRATPEPIEDATKKEEEQEVSADVDEEDTPNDPPEKKVEVEEDILLKTTIHLDSVVQLGAAAILSQNQYRLFINNIEVASGRNQTQPNEILLNQRFKPGKNDIVVLLMKANTDRAHSGFFIEGSLRLASGSKFRISTDEKWQWCNVIPKQRSRRLGKVTGEWRNVEVIPEFNKDSRNAKNRIKALNSRVFHGEFPMIRTSLIKSDFLMRSLGRPLREQIVSSRPSELTTLEAIDLTNGATLAKYLEEGARNIVNGDWQSSQKLVQHLFVAALSRTPTADEMAVILESLDANPSPQQVEDLLWVLVMMPEFMLVH